MLSEEVFPIFTRGGGGLEIVSIWIPGKVESSNRVACSLSFYRTRLTDVCLALVCAAATTRPHVSPLGRFYGVLTCWRTRSAYFHVFQYHSTLSDAFYSKYERDIGLIRVRQLCVDKSRSFSFVFLDAFFYRTL